jgi:hypothetical protein
MNKQDTRFTFFFPDARVLSVEEIQALTLEKKQASQKVGGKGVWLNINCPDASCISGEGRITIPATGVEHSKKGFWLNLFCPEDTCEIHQATDLP